MADTNNVYITGSNPGSLEEAFGDLPPWATQKTSEDIQSLLKDILKVETKALDAALKCCASSGNNGPSKEEIQSVNDEINKLSKNFKNLNQDADKARKQNAKDEKARKDNQDSDNASSMAWNKMIGLSISAGKGLLTVQKQYFTTSHDLFKSGVNLLDGQKAGVTSMNALNNIVTLTGLRLETFQKAVQKYSSSINAIGVNKFAKAISESNNRLISLGFSSEQQAELIGTLIESESLYADIRNKSSTELANDAVILGRQMTRLSLITGQSTEKLQENLKSLAKNTDSTVVSALYGEKAASRMNLLASSFDPELATRLQKFAAAVSPQNTQAYQELVQAGQGQLANELVNIAVAARNGAIGIEDARSQIIATGKNIATNEVGAIALRADINAEGNKGTLDFIAQLRAAGNKTSTATNEQVDAATAAQASLSNFSTALERTRSLAEMAFPLLETQVDAASKALGLLNTSATTLATQFSPEARAIAATVIQIAALGAIVFQTIPLLKSFGSLIGKAASSLPGGNTGGTGGGRAGAARGLLGGLLRFGVPLAAMTYSGGLNTNEDEELAKRRALGPTIYNGANAPTSPAPSVIASPSAIPPTTETPNNREPAAPTPAPSSLPPTPSSSSINSILEYQSMQLNQLLDSLRSLISVNQDILRQAKIH